jgi:hypothetical protein
MARGGRLAGLDVANNDEVDVFFLLTHVGAGSMKSNAIPKFASDVRDFPGELKD